MLKVDLAELIREPGRHIEHKFNDLPQVEEGLDYMSNAVGRVTISNAGALVVVRGAFKTTIRMECGRCLKEVIEPIDAEIDEQYTLSDMAAAGNHDGTPSIVGDEENELPPNLMFGTIIDLAALVRQSTMLAAPISVICKEDCKGLCPVCGKNLNEDADGCKCKKKNRNTPFAVLREYFDTDGSDNQGSESETK